MALAVAHSRGLDGLNAPPVVVEAHLASGLPSFTLIGTMDPNATRQGYHEYCHQPTR